jgi:secreted trypsin-like serine protease
VATASGWGLPSDGAETISDVLRSVQVPVGANSGCNLYYFGVIQDTHLCTASDGGKSTCSGDSGGPLVASSGELVSLVLGGPTGSHPYFSDWSHLLRHLLRVRNRLASRLHARHQILGLDRRELRRGNQLSNAQITKTNQLQNKRRFCKKNCFIWF